MKQIYELKDLAIYKELGKRGSRKVKVKMVDHFSRTKIPNKDEIVAYLNSGHLFNGWMNLEWDYFDKNNGFAAPNGSHTDGVWSWTCDLSHYVEKYNLILPSLFLEHMKSKLWQISNQEELEAAFRFNDDTYIFCRSNWYENVEEWKYVWTKRTSE